MESNGKSKKIKWKLKSGQSSAFDWSDLLTLIIIIAFLRRGMVKSPEVKRIIENHQILRQRRIYHLPIIMLTAIPTELFLKLIKQTR